jgi:hypothetical protein
VRCPRVRDRVGEGSERIHFSSAILPPYARRSKSLEVLIPILYLKGVSTGDNEGRRQLPPDLFDSDSRVAWWTSQLLKAESRKPVVALVVGVELCNGVTCVRLITE